MSLPLEGYFILVWCLGQSNSEGQATGTAIATAGAPAVTSGGAGDSGVPYYCRIVPAVDTLTFGNLRTISSRHGAEVALLQRLKYLRGLTVACFKHAKGGEAIREWREDRVGNAMWDDLVATVAVMAPQAITLAAGRPIMHIVHWQQGESDCTSGVLGSQYLGNMQYVFPKIRALILSEFPNTPIAPFMISRLPDALDGDAGTLDVKAAMVSWCASDIYGSFIYTTEPVVDNGLYSPPHWVGAQGYYEVGVLAESAGYSFMQSRVSNMGSFSTAQLTALVNHLRNEATITPAATHYMHLYSGGGTTTPISGNGYAVVSKTNNTTTWPPPSSRSVSNGVAWTFPTPTGTWADVTGFKITDNATEGAGAVIYSESFAAKPVSVATGPISFGVSSIVITAAAGGLSDYSADGSLGLIFGGTAFAPLATTHGSYWAGDPQGAGTIAGGSVSMTQADEWAPASAGVAVTDSDIALTQQVTGTYWAEHSAATGGGNLLYSASRPAATGASGTILAGQLRMVFT